MVATDIKGFHDMTRQLDVEAQQWSGWTPFATVGSLPRLALDYNADGRLTFFSHPVATPPKLGGLWCKSQMALDSTEWELAWTELAPDGIQDYAVVRDLTPPTS